MSIIVNNVFSYNDVTLDFFELRLLSTIDRHQFRLKKINEDYLRTVN